MKKMISAKKLLLIAAVLPLLGGCIVVHDHPRRYPPVETMVIEAPASPAPRYEVVPGCPGPEYVWIPGCHEWRGGNWVWVGGRWGLRPHRGAMWVAPHWEHRGRGHVWIGGGWR